MGTRTTSGSVVENLKTLYGVAFSLACALCSEFFLRAFLTRTDALSTTGRTTVLFLSLYVIHRFANSSFRAYRPRGKDYLTLGTILLGSMMVIWLARFLALSIATSSVALEFVGGASRSSWDFVIPFAAGSLVLRAILGLQYGLVCGLSLAIIVGLYVPGQPLLIPHVLATSLAACLSLSRFRSRSAYLQAGLTVFVISLPFALASCVVEEHLILSDVLIRILGSAAAGMLCAFIASGITPLFEYFGGYVTDMRLIEMATLDHPLLKDLSIQAPGTWNHSMVMGMMGESAADAIGANPVVTRVGAYFHDIGKVKKPLYFVENQGGAENRHDKLSPSMSALIIRAHVKDGIDLAEQFKLPGVILDMIPQHHGTSVIEYFYEKARKECEEAGQDPDSVDRSLYAYPGPKPQTKEAGILMLADGIEAASRTVSDPSFDRIQGLVQKMINKVFASGELDECELTLRDLHQIAKCFTRILSGIYHQRIAYAEPAEKTNPSEPNNTQAPVDNSNISDPGRADPEEAGGQKDTKEGLKRLGLQ